MVSYTIKRQDGPAFHEEAFKTAKEVVDFLKPFIAKEKEAAAKAKEKADKKKKKD